MIPTIPEEWFLFRKMTIFIKKLFPNYPSSNIGKPGGTPPHCSECPSGRPSTHPQSTSENLKLKMYIRIYPLDIIQPQIWNTQCALNKKLRKPFPSPRCARSSSVLWRLTEKGGNCYNSELFNNLSSIHFQALDHKKKVALLKINFDRHQIHVCCTVNQV